MKFAAVAWLAGVGVGLVVALFFALGGIGLLKSIKRFGRPEQVQLLLTANASGRRASKSVLLVLAVILCFVALAGPQYGRGTRLIPATNLDVVIALDYSKSMYARDVAPNRIERAKAEVGRLIRDLPGARFGAVGFAGQPLSFPLTSDGGAIAQFFRQLTPNDMPIGGTAIARALDAARGLFQRDPLSKKHKRVIVLATDGEDLEGDPVNVARAAASEEISVHVVQIGGRSPEPIPEVAEDGSTTGLRRDKSGRPLTTQLSAAGEKQLTQIAESSGGSIVRSEDGQTGIEEISRRLKALMTEELSERVETVYADIYFYPLGAALLLLFLEAFLGQTPRRTRRSLPSPSPTPPESANRHSVKPRATSGEPESRAGLGSRASVSLSALLCALLGCAQVAEVEEQVFVRHSPAVDEAIAAIDSNRGADAASLLTTYLSTGTCQGGELAVSDLVRERPEAGFDLGLALFQVGETFGQRFGIEPVAGTKDPNAEQQLVERSSQVDCALRVVRVIAQDEGAPLELRAHAFYLAGNLEFLRRDYEAAVKNYDDSLRLWPGAAQPEQATVAPPGAAASPSELVPSVGDRAAWNRAIALGRIQQQEREQPDAGPPKQDQQDSPQDDQKQDQDSPDDKPPDDPGEDQKDPQDQPGEEEKDEPQKEQPPDEGQGDQQTKPEPGQQDQQENPAAQSDPQAANPSLSNDDRILDLLEQAPTLQQAAARAQRGGATQHMEDK